MRIYSSGHLMCPEELKCVTCNKVFETRAAFNGHSTSYTHCRVRCPICSKIVLRRAFSSHKKVHEAKGYMHKCDICDKYYKSQKTLDNHISIIHNNVWKVQCDKCGKRFPSTAAYKSHFEANHTPKRTVYKCEICDKAYLRMISYSEHIKTHDKNYAAPQHLCSECGKVYSTMYGLQLHKKLHNDPKYACTFCEKSFKLRSYLRRHIRVHTGERPYPCDICEKAFRTTSERVDHIRTHTNERPHKCNLCDKRFTQRHSLKAHIRSHTGEKPFECQTCEKRFITAGLLNSHVKKTHGDKEIEST